MQETQVWRLVREGPRGHGAAKLLCHDSGAQELQLTKPKCPRACDQQQEKPMQRQACRESQRSNEDPAQSKIQKINNTI